MHTHPILLDASLLTQFRHWCVGPDGTFAMLLFLGAAGLVALVVFGWAVMSRKQNLHHTLKPAQSNGGGHEHHRGIFSRHKHRRKKHRPTNPTLAETGGLPPARDPNTPAKSPL